MEHHYFRMLHSFIGYGRIDTGDGGTDDHHDDHDDAVAATDDYAGGGTPLNDVTRPITIAVHYAAIPAVTLCIWAVLTRYAVFQRRVYSPFILMVALSWLLIASTFEIANHFYVNNWQLYESQADLINGSFSFFNFGAQNLMAISLRANGTAWLRHCCFGCSSPAATIGVQKTQKSHFRGTCSKIGDWLGFIIDPVLLALIVINPIVYGVAGRDTANSALSPIAGVAAIFTMCRVWYNLGPNAYTKYGGIGFFVLAIIGVMMLALYNSSGDEWVHILIGGSFVSSVLPLAVGFYNAQDKQVDDVDSSAADSEGHDDVETSSPAPAPAEANNEQPAADEVAPAATVEEEV